MDKHFFVGLKQRIGGIPRTPRELNYSLQLLSVMRRRGWHKSLRQARSVDKNGLPIPYYTYAALDWLMPRVKPTDEVFEFGSGWSTVWYGQHAREVVAVEHNPVWVNRVKAMVGSNVTLLLRTPSPPGASPRGGSEYCGALGQYPPKSFDIIVIDGMERVQCAYGAPSRMRDDGIIVFDNSERIEFKPGIDYLHEQGLGRIDFYGFIAMVGTRICTSIFSRFGSRWIRENVPLVPQGG
jgi:hypothetical protein